MGEKCLVVDGVYTCRTCMPGEGDVWILHSAEIDKDKQQATKTLRSSMDYKSVNQRSQTTRSPNNRVAE